MRCGRRELVDQVDYAFQADRDVLAVHKDAAVVAHAVASEIVDGSCTKFLKRAFVPRFNPNK